MKLLLDTNVLIDLVLNRKPYVEDTRKLMVAGFYHDAELWASAKSFTDVFYVARKVAPNVSVAYDAIQAIARELSICSIDATDVGNALSLRWPDFEDCVVYQAARKLKADYLITRNGKDFAGSSVPTMTPTEFLDHMADKRRIRYAEVRLESNELDTAT